MDDALRRETGHRLAGMILLSDGAQNALYPHDESPQTPAVAWPIWACPSTPSCSARKSPRSQRQDVAVTGLDVSPTVYVKNELTIRGTVRISGYLNSPCRCRPYSRLRRAACRSGRLTIAAGRQRRRGDSGRIQLRATNGGRAEGDAARRAEARRARHDEQRAEQFRKGVSRRLERVLSRRGAARRAAVPPPPLASSPDIKVDFQWIDSGSERIGRSIWRTVSSPANMMCTSSATRFQGFSSGGSRELATT